MNSKTKPVESKVDFLIYGVSIWTENDHFWGANFFFPHNKRPGGACYYAQSLN